MSRTDNEALVMLRGKERPDWSEADAAFYASLGIKPLEDTGELCDWRDLPVTPRSESRYWKAVAAENEKLAFFVSYHRKRLIEAHDLSEAEWDDFYRQYCDLRRTCAEDDPKIKALAARYSRDRKRYQPGPDATPAEHLVAVVGGEKSGNGYRLPCPECRNRRALFVGPWLRMITCENRCGVCRDDLRAMYRAARRTQ